VRGQIEKLSLSIDPKEGFLGALQHSLDTFQKRYGVDTELILRDFQPVVSLAPMVEVQLLRITQEALTNIRRHAQAKKVLMSLTRDAGCLELIIEDDGIGFEPDNLPPTYHSFGLGIMAARAQDVGGCIAVQSNPGQGTRIVVVIPGS
jgi:two-component system nitrate/nitrite sensor histidine kinase NarX